MYSAWKSGNLVVFSKAVLTFSAFLTHRDHYGISLCQNGDSCVRANCNAIVEKEIVTVLTRSIGFHLTEQAG
jgi:hypothetical protein